MTTAAVRPNNHPDIPQNMLDKVISTIAPQWAARRLQNRISMSLANQFYGSFGQYDGAAIGKRETNSWTPFHSDADTASVYDLPALRSRSRDALRNQPLAGGAVNTVVTNVVGGGLNLQSQIDRSILGLSDEEADAWQRAAEREWSLWADSQDCDLYRTLNFRALTELAFRSALENGDCFTLLPRISRPGSPYSLRIQLVEADRISNPSFGLNTISRIAGVEKDDNGAPKGYWVARQHPGNALTLNQDQFRWDYYPAFGEKTGLRNVIHLYHQKRIGQSRGIPYLAPVIEPLKMLGRYTQAELMAAVVSGMFTVFVKSEGAQTLAGMPTAPGARPVVTYGNQSALPENQRDVRLGNGMVIELDRGESIETANPGRPNPAFDPFFQAVLRQVGVLLEIPFELLIKHYTASYSAARAAMLDGWKFFSARRSWLADNFCQVVYEIFLAEAVALGRLNAPGFFRDPLIRKAYCRAMWIGPPKGQIDELKEIEAAEKRISVGISTIAQETVSYNGGDFEANTAQRAREQALRKAAGLVEEPKTVSAAAPPTNENSGNSDLEVA